MGRAEVIHAVVAGLAAGGLGGCAPAEKTATPAAAAPVKAAAAQTPGPTPPPAPAAGVETVFVPEMQPFGQDYTTLVRVPRRDLIAFGEAWQAVRPTVEAAVTPEKLAEISRWSKDQTKAARLEPGWLAGLPMNLRGGTADGWRLLFGQEAQESPAELPSHAGNVHRRILVAPVFDRGSKAITRVYISIGGWAEE